MSESDSGRCLLFLLGRSRLHRRDATGARTGLCRRDRRVTSLGGYGEDTPALTAQLEQRSETSDCLQRRRTGAAQIAQNRSECQWRSTCRRFAEAAPRHCRSMDSAHRKRRPGSGAEIHPNVRDLLRTRRQPCRSAVDHEPPREDVRLRLPANARQALVHDRRGTARRPPATTPNYGSPQLAETVKRAAAAPHRREWRHAFDVLPPAGRAPRPSRSAAR